MRVKFTNFVMLFTNTLQFRNANGRKWPKSRDGYVRIPYVIEDKYSKLVMVYNLINYMIDDLS